MANGTAYDRIFGKKSGRDPLDALTGALNQLPNLVDGCVEAFNKIVAIVNARRGSIDVQPAGSPSRGITQLAIFFINRDIESIRRNLTVPLDIAEKVLQNHAPLVSLFRTSYHYLEKVQDPLVSISSDISTPADDNLYYWTGAARHAYNDKREAQSAAVEAVADFAQQMSGWLLNIGKMNTAYVVRLVQALSDILAELVAVTVNAVTIVNILFALDGVSSAIKKTVQALLNELAEQLNEMVATIEGFNMMAAAKNTSALSGGRWPQSVYDN